jgi:transcriptional regulator with XRE-family HTH domain
MSIKLAASAAVRSISGRPDDGCGRLGEVGCDEVCDYRTMAEPGWSGIGERVQAARAALGMSQAELGRVVGLDRTMIAKIESGARRVDALELSRLSSALRLPMAHFLGVRPPVLSRRAVAFTQDTESEAGRESSLLDLALEGWIRDLRQLIGLSVLEQPAMLAYPSAVHYAQQAREAAGWLRAQLGCDSDPIDSLLAFAAQAGQFVLVTELAGDGASAVDGELAAAVVSLKGAPSRRRATVAHELGHLVLGDEYSSDLGVHSSRADRESVVDAFAAELLLPVSAFAEVELSGDLESRNRLLGIAAKYRTSWSLALRQAEVAGIGAVPRSWARSTPTKAEFLEAVGWSPQPDLGSVRVPPVVAHSVMEGWRRGLIARRRAIELMHGQIEDSDLPVDVDTELEP